MRNYEKPGIPMTPTDIEGVEPFTPEPPLAVIEIRAPWGNVQTSGRRRYSLHVRFPDGTEPEHLERIQAIADAARRAAEGTSLITEAPVLAELRSIRTMIEGDFEEPGILARLDRMRPSPESHNFIGRRDRACRACGKKFGEGNHVVGVPAKRGR